MTEKEKMIQGKLYDARDEELVTERTRAKELCHALNQMKPSQSERQRELTQILFGKTGEGCNVTPPFWCDYGYNIEVGKDFYTNHNCVILDCTTVTFGDRVLIGPNCGFYTAEHPVALEERRTGLESARPIRVGDDVWFGGGVQVMPGVTIGSHVVIGAGSVVTKDIPDNVIAAGNPCRVIKSI